MTVGDLKDLIKDYPDEYDILLMNDKVGGALRDVHVFPTHPTTLCLIAKYFSGLTPVLQDKATDSDDECGHY